VRKGGNNAMKLISFSVKNYKSIKEKIELSMVAGSINERKDSNVFAIGKNIELLKSAAIYGPNASGKTSIFEALIFMLSFIRNSAKESQIGESIKTIPHLLNSSTENDPSFFELVFLDCSSENIYRYGFEVTREKVIKEWLYYWNYLEFKKREKYIFIRNEQDFYISRDFRKEISPRIGHSKDKALFVRNNSLLLSFLANINSKLAGAIVMCLNNIDVSCSSNVFSKELSNKYLNDKDGSKKINAFLKTADFGIDKAEILSENIDEEMPKKQLDSLFKGFSIILKSSKIIVPDEIITYHKKYNSEGKVDGSVSFFLDKDESEGTKRYYNLAGYIIKCLEKGSVLIIDEIDKSLHTLLTKYIIEMFNSKISNPNNGQLIFTAQDTNLLSDIFRRDQIWFIEKDRYGASSLTSLLEYKVRKEDSFEKDYIKGRYGALPIISILLENKLFDKEDESDE